MVATRWAPTFTADFFDLDAASLIRSLPCDCYKAYSNDSELIGRLGTNWRPRLIGTGRRRGKLGHRFLDQGRVVGIVQLDLEDLASQLDGQLSAATRQRFHGRVGRGVDIAQRPQ